MSLVWLCIAAQLIDCVRAAEPLRLEGRSMGTTWHVTAYAACARAAPLRERIEATLQNLTQQMSAWEPDSALSHFNRAAAGSWTQLPSDLFLVLDHALDLAQQTDGAFDPTVAPLVDLWGFGPDGAPRHEPPSRRAIVAAQAHVGWSKLQLDRHTHRALQPGGIRLDVNALGPGHGVDAVARVLQQAGVEHFLVELGGEMRAAGSKPDGTPWRVAVESPDVAADPLDTVVDLHDAAVGTSGDYRVGFVHNGRRYSHTIDPRSGAPVTHALAAVTVIAPSAMAADARAAALMVLGPDAGMAFAQAHGLAALFTLHTQDGLVRRATPAFEGYLSR